MNTLVSGQLLAQEDVLTEETLLFEHVTTPYGDAFTAQNVLIQMRDETSIAVDIYRPIDEASRPTLYAAGPYPHSVDILTDQLTHAGTIAWFVSQGYAFVIANVRGTGLSNGDFSFLSREEQQDHYEIIEWIAEQPWSDGQVAGAGAGYYAASQWQMAIQNPPNLECIAPFNGTLDPLREWIYPGGLLNNTYINDWYDRKVRLANAYAPDSPRIINYDLRFEQLNHQFDDVYWQIRSSLENTDQINVPVFAIHDWSLNKFEPGLFSTLSALSKLNPVNKALITSPSENIPLNQDTRFLSSELMPYYEWCFNGRNPNSAFAERSRIRYLVKGQNIVKSESSWPPGNITHEAWFLNNIAPDNIDMPASLDDRQLTESVQLSPYNTVSDEAMIRFVSPTLDEDLEIAGPVMMELYASSTSFDLAFEVTVSEEFVAEIPESRPSLPSFLTPVVPQVEPQTESNSETTTQEIVTRGILKGSARARDGEKSSEFAPVYSLTEKEELQPGQIHRLDIALHHTAYRFSAGNRLVLEIKTVNDGSFPEASAAELLYHDRQNPSRLWLPVVQSPQDTAISAAQTGIETEEGIEASSVGNSPFQETDNEINSESQNPQIFVPR